jgi:hypothetical protein
LKHTNGDVHSVNTSPDERRPATNHVVGTIAVLTAVATAATWLYAGPLAAMIIGPLVFIAAIFLLLTAAIARSALASLLHREQRESQ